MKLLRLFSGGLKAPLFSSSSLEQINLWSLKYFLVVCCCLIWGVCVFSHLALFAVTLVQKLLGGQLNLPQHWQHK